MKKRISMGRYNDSLSGIMKAVVACHCCGFQMDYDKDKNDFPAVIFDQIAYFVCSNECAVGFTFTILSNPKFYTAWYSHATK